jgi:pimeloyl-ACP methyl ester carboxylesterase
VRLASYVVGNGERAVALLHGFLGSGRNLRTLATRWSAADPSLRIVVPDLTGHGASSRLPAEASLESVAQDVADTLDARGASQPARWVGHSFGGRVALAGARHLAGRMGGIDLLDIGPGAVSEESTPTKQIVDVLSSAPERAPDRSTMRRFLAARLSPPLADWLAMNLAPAEGGGMAWRIDREALRAAHRWIVGESLWDVIDAGKVPVRCARGARSGFVPEPDVARLEASGCPVATFDAGHFLHVDALDPLLAWLAAGD